VHIGIRLKDALQNVVHGLCMSIQRITIEKYYI
jgi:hypothetical protein